MATVTIYVEYLKKGSSGTIVAQDATYACEVKTQTNYDTRQQTTALVLPNPNGVFGSGTYGVAYTDSKHYGGSAYIINSSTPQYWRNWNNAGAGRTSSVEKTEKGELITAQLLYTSATSGNYVIRFRVLSYHDVTVDATGSPFAINVSAPFTASVAAGTKQTFTVEGEPKVTVKVAGDRSYGQYFLRYDLDGVSTGHTSASVAYSFTVSGDHTIKAVYGNHPRATLAAPEGASATAHVRYKNDAGTYVDGPTFSVAEGQTATFPVAANADPQLVVAWTLAEGAEIETWLDNGSELTSLTGSSGTITNLWGGHIYTVRLQYPFYVDIVAPSGVTIGYTFGRDGEHVKSGTVYGGQTAHVKLYKGGTGNMTLVLEANPFDAKTFGGWTKNGTIVDRWSNPATLIANDPATYSCIIGEAPEPETGSGKLLCGKYGTLLYAGNPTTKSHTVALKATYRGTGTHNVSWSLGDESGYEEAVTGLTKSVAVSKTLFPGGSSVGGRLLFADHAVREAPWLIRATFHCEVSEHEYDVTLSVDGVEVYSATRLSGTFSKTLEVT